MSCSASQTPCTAQIRCQHVSALDGAALLALIHSAEWTTASRGRATCPTRVHLPGGSTRGPTLPTQREISLACALQPTVVTTRPARTQPPVAQVAPPRPRRHPTRCRVCCTSTGPGPRLPMASNGRPSGAANDGPGRRFYNRVFRGQVAEQRIPLRRLKDLKPGHVLVIRRDGTSVASSSANGLFLVFVW